MRLHRASTSLVVAISFTSLLISTGCTVERDEPNLEGQDVAITLMHTSDIHSRFLPYFFSPGQIDKGLGLVPPAGQTTALVGGISRISSILKCARGIYGRPFCDSLYPEVGDPASRSIHVDSGDIFQGAPIFNVFSGEAEMRAMSQVGLTAMVIANHEFDKGAVNLFTQWQRFGGFPMLAANYMFGDPRDPTQNKLGLVVPPYIIVNVGGLKVGLIGMANLSSIQGLIEGGNSLGIRPIPEEQALSWAAQVLRPQVDLLAVVSHLGLDEDEGVAVSDSNLTQDEALSISGVDLIMGGHLHIVLNPPKDLPRFDSQTGEFLGHTVLCHSGAFAKYVGRLDLVVHVPSKEEKAAGIRGGIKSYVYRVIPVNEDVPEDPDLVRLLEPYQLQMNRRLNLTQVFALIPCDRNQTGNCPKVVRNAPEGGDSQLGNLVATAMRLRRRVEADFALTNSLGIRADFESGPLDLEQMYNVFPFENTIATMFLSGVEVKQMLDFVAARSSERGCRAQAQVSGIYFDMVCARGDVECCPDGDDPDAVACRSGQTPAHPCAKNIYLGDGCRKPDGSMDTARCRPLDAFALYRVAVNDYIANGGSGFSVLKRNTTKFNTGISLRDALIDYIRTLEGTCDPAQYGNVAGVWCRDAKGKKYDCSDTCCCHDAESGPVACSTKCAAFEACKTASPPMSPEPYDYSTTACLVPGGIQAPDGRIRPITVVR
jgi:5'-nucleotidase